MTTTKKAPQLQDAKKKEEQCEGINYLQTLSISYSIKVIELKSEFLSVFGYVNGACIKHFLVKKVRWEKPKIKKSMLINFITDNSFRVKIDQHA